MIRMEGIINLALLEQLDNEIQRDENKLEMRLLRDKSDPFNLPDIIFSKYYRLTKECTRELIHILQPHLAELRYITAVPIELKVLTMLYFLGHGSYQKCVGLNLHHSLEQSTVSKIISELTDCMVEHLMPNFIQFPDTVEAKNIVKQQFYEKFNFPGIIGAIDCTHIGIIAPPAEDPIHPGLAYYNRKGFYSLNVQMVCDANLIFTNCNARFPGSVHDSAIWSLSSVKQLLQTSYVNGELHSAWLIGDSGYPLEPWLLTPIQNAPPNTAEARYTESHIRARNCIERAFGTLKQRFRCLSHHRILHFDPVRAAKIIYSAVILHNLCIRNQIPQAEDNIPDAENLHPIYQENEVDENVNQNDWYQEGRRIRSQFVNRHFI